MIRVLLLIVVPLIVPAATYVIWRTFVPPKFGGSEAIARDQETADAILSLARSTFLHSGFEGRKATGGNLAFPFSPSDFRGGPVFEFNVYHLMEVDDPSAPFSVEFEDIRNRHLVPT